MAPDALHLWPAKSAAQGNKKSRSIRHPSRTCSFVPQLLACSQVQSDSLYSSQKTKAAPPPLCENSAWRCGWLCRSLIVQATGERGSGMAASLQDTAREGGTDRCEPPSFLPHSLLLFHSLYPKLAAGRQMNAVWSEPTEVQGPAVQATKELHARHLLFSYQNTFSHVPPFPAPSPFLFHQSHAASILPTQSWSFLSAQTSSMAFFLRSLLCWCPPPTTTTPLCTSFYVAFI